ncbi:acyl carrier protein [Helicovermis profundi]|uniref:Acyl carrier protein n=1 Tax=Helicovermis profundi TaxID=3065157 RepID=A0AAU9E858_9FIRM|nr:acyl carrier protein [Clostridia bacterium S502]
MFEIIKKIIVEQLNVTDPDLITYETSIHSDLDADSLDAVEIVMNIEDEFDIEIPDEVAEKFETIENIIDYLHTVL